MYRSLAIAAAALVLSVPAYAQTVDEIVAKNLEAKGGEQRLRETNSVRLTGVVTLQGQTGPTLTLSKRPNMMRREITLGGQKLVQGYDGTTLWMSTPGAPPQEIPAGPQADMMKRNFEFDSAFLDWQKKGHKIELKGKVTEGGKELFHVVLTQKDAPPLHYYLDATTGLEVKTVMDIEDPTVKGQMETRFADYRNIDGRMIPFTMTQTLNGQQVAQIRLERIEFNVPLEDALFKLPKGPGL
jgi:outer membrane lipoprotein-sorting protein